MKTCKLTHQRAMELVAQIPPGTKLISAERQKWDVVVEVRECGDLNGRFLKSIKTYVDDPKKKGALLLCFQELYNAVVDDDYQKILAGTGVSCKTAHSFQYEGRAIKVWELKPNNKDRVYFFPLTEGYIEGRKAIFLLSVYHKKDTKTPKEISQICEEDIKSILRSRGNIVICEDKNVAKK